MEDVLLSDLARTCVGQFRDVFNIIQQTTISLDADISVSFEEQVGRFNIWAGNLGVFAQAHGSLDYRLRDSPVAKDLAMKQLEGLQNGLERASEIINEQDYIGEYSDSEELQYDQFGLKQSSSSSFASSSNFTSSEEVSNNEHPFINLLHNNTIEIGQIIDRLYRLSLFIRRPSSLNQNSKADAFMMMDEEGNDASPAFKSYVLQVLLTRYPPLPEYLRQRLSDAVVSRRKRFLWRQRHQQKLDPKGLAVSHEDRKAQGMAMTQRTVTSSRANHLPMVLSRELGLKALPSTRFSTTTATQLSKERVGFGIDLDAVSAFSTVYHAGSTSPIAVPPPPKLPPGRTEFLCPYCCTVLMSRETESRRWKQHILHDIEPYICLLEGCEEETETYRLPNSWLSHQQSHHEQNHAVQWVCTSPSHQPQTFNEEAQYETHLRESHSGSFSESQIPTLKKMNQRRSISLFTKCPLCDLPMSDLEKDTNESSPQAVDLMIDHIRHHLEAIALLSLPWLDNVDGASSGKTVSDKVSTVSSNDIRKDLVLEFEDISLGYRNGDDDEVVSSIKEDQFHEFGWSFLPKIFYSGPERDPVLQPFLRKLYLGLSPTLDTVQGPVLPCYFMPRAPKKRCTIRSSVLEMLERGLCANSSSHTSDNTTLKSFALCGPGGMGKTSAASEFVRRNRDRFDAVLWVHADSEAKLLQDFRDIAVKLGLVAEDSIDANDQILTRNLLKSWLINPYKRAGVEHSLSTEQARWLLVFDGVDDAGALDDAWPYDAPGSILITSRDPLSFDTFSKVIPLGPLSNDDAVQFLLCLTNKENNRSEAKHAHTVAKRIGGVPLILAQMAGMIMQQHWSMLDFLEAYEKRQSVDSESPMVVHKHVLASVWALESLKHGKGLLNILSMLDPDGIPEQILTAHMDSARQEGYPRNANAYHRAKYELLSTSLIGEDRDTRHLWLHRMCQDVAKTQMDPYSYRSTFLDCVRLISNAWPYELFTWRHGVERWATCSTLFPHVAWLLDLDIPVEFDDDSIDGYYEFARLLTDAGWYYHERGHSDESVRFSDMALTILKPLATLCAGTARLNEGPFTVHKEHVEASIAEIFHNKGCFATETNQPAEALEFHSTFHKMMLQKFASTTTHKDMRLAISWNELGNAYMLNCDWNQGKRCFEMSIADMKLLDDFDKLQLSLPLVNLALAYWVTGELDQASTLLLEALMDREAVFGHDDSDSFITGRILHALGNVKYSQGLHEDSFSYHRRALLQYKSTLGNNHHRTADLCVKVATHHQRLRHWELARALLNQALKIYDDRKVFLPEIVRVMFNQCKVYRALGRNQEAASLEDDFLRSYQTLAPLDQRPVAQLNDQAMDDLIVFWSR